MTDALKEALKKVDLWPREAQEELADIASAMDQSLRKSSYVASDRELAGIDRGLADVEAGRFSPPERIAALLDKYRVK